MKATFRLFVFVLISGPVAAQVNIVPYAGVNSTKMYQSYGFEKGGSYGLVGLELELRKRPQQPRNVYVTFVTGISYLKNGFYKSDNFSYTALSYYTASITDRRMEYIQIPVVLRVNWQPFPLVEDFKAFFGAGVNNNLLQKATLRESYTSVFISSDVLAPPEAEHYEDSRDVSDLGRKHSLYMRFELGMVYKRIQVSFRVSKGISDLYYTGLENDWAVPAEFSEYLQAYAEEGNIREKYTEIVVGYRLFR